MIERGEVCYYPARQGKAPAIPAVGLVFFYKCGFAFYLGWLYGIGESGLIGGYFGFMRRLALRPPRG